MLSDIAIVMLPTKRLNMTREDITMKLDQNSGAKK
jgi:hypothetical protein